MDDHYARVLEASLMVEQLSLGAVLRVRGFKEQYTGGRRWLSAGRKRCLCAPVLPASLELSVHVTACLAWLRTLTRWDYFRRLTLSPSMLSIRVPMFPFVQLPNPLVSTMACP